MTQKDFNYSSIPVKDIMKKTLIFVDPETTAFQIAKLMKEGGISEVFVKEKKNFVGIITDRDFAIKIEVNKLPFDTPAKKIMSSPIITIDQNQTISVAAKMMVDRKIRKLAVSDNDKIVGRLGSLDLVKQLAK